MRTTLRTLPLLAGTAVWAHDGHGAAAGHLHAFDVIGLAALAVLLGAWIWHRRGR